jgi:hypothetical protein
MHLLHEFFVREFRENDVVVSHASHPVLVRCFSGLQKSMRQRLLFETLPDKELNLNRDKTLFECDVAGINSDDDGQKHAGSGSCGSQTVWQFHLAHVCPMLIAGA